jgi:predicted phage tail protein
MKATDIVEKFKKILLSETEEKVEEIEVQEDVVLAEHDSEEMPEEIIEEVKEDEKEELYATKEELSKAVAELKAMYESLMESKDLKESPEVPEELSSEETKEVQEEQKEELSAQEPEVEPIAHSPESNVENKNIHLYSQNRAMTIMDKVINKISK